MRSFINCTLHQILLGWAGRVARMGDMSGACNSSFGKSEWTKLHRGPRNG
jgi:hypothetical protein